MCSSTDLTVGMSEKLCTITASEEDLALVFKLWPENFLGLYDMGFRSFERLFNHRPQLKAFMQLPADESWKQQEKMKKIVLALEQTLVQAVATFAEPDSDPENTPEAFALHLQEIGGLHRGIVPQLSPDNFELLFKLLPEVIADVTSSRRAEGPLTPDERSRLLSVWSSISSLMSRHFVLGWERRVVPKNPKFSEIFSARKTSAGVPQAQQAQQGAAQEPPQMQLDQGARPDVFRRVMAPIEAVRRLK